MAICFMNVQDVNGRGVTRICCYLATNYTSRHSLQLQSKFLPVVEYSIAIFVCWMKLRFIFLCVECPRSIFCVFYSYRMLIFFNLSLCYINLRCFLLCKKEELKKAHFVAFFAYWTTKNKRKTRFIGRNYERQT